MFQLLKKKRKKLRKKGLGAVKADAGPCAFCES